MTQIGSVFLPVHDTAAAAAWYSERFGMTVRSCADHAAVLDAGSPPRTLTLMGPPSGIGAEPGLRWAPFNLVAADLAAVRARLAETGEVGPVSGDERTCFWFTAADPDGNTLLIVDR
ncbi:VOC family protein [Glycomyces sp. MUSA5-2]|uniref:VOC family protein n=1 Tax=Glycomyces sp. MUSA5-2 TaxID=2053002 RepID=UPI0030087A79